MNLPHVLRASALSFALLVLVHPGFSASTGNTPEEKLAALGLKLPPTSTPVANYVPAVRSGSLVFLAGHIARGADGKAIAGKVGRNATEQEAKAAAGQTALALLATLKKEIGELSRVKRIVKVNGFVNGVEDFQGQPQVMNGCSDLLVSLFGDRGKHARSAIGAGSLPLGAMVEIEMIVEVE